MTSPWTELFTVGHGFVSSRDFRGRASESVLEGNGTDGSMSGFPDHPRETNIESRLLVLRALGLEVRGGSSLVASFQSARSEEGRKRIRGAGWMGRRETYRWGFRRRPEGVGQKVADQKFL